MIRNIIHWGLQSGPFNSWKPEKMPAGILRALQPAQDPFSSFQKLGCIVIAVKAGSDKRPSFRPLPMCIELEILTAFSGSKESLKRLKKGGTDHSGIPHSL